MFGNFDSHGLSIKVTAMRINKVSFMKDLVKSLNPSCEKDREVTSSNEYLLDIKIKMSTY